MAETLHPELLTAYDYLRRDFARLCVALAARKAGLPGSFAIHGTDKTSGFPLDIAELLEEVHKDLNAVENLLNIPYEPSIRDSTVVDSEPHLRLLHPSQE